MKKYLSETALIEAVKKGDSFAAELLYRRFSSTFFGVCLRYARNRMDAEDILHDAMIKIFSKLDSYNFNGSFEGWARRIVVNTAIDFYHAQLKWKENTQDIDELRTESSVICEMPTTVDLKKILSLIQSLPEPHRIVFNLFAIEGFSHKEIAEILGISENLSKSYLFRARKYLQKKIKVLEEELL
ncbi:MAG: RNA polymerase sigma factor [Bacteroidales bacterium]|nr:RNA polymerase sigma factor [Bacteroidales bacterium]